MSRIYMTPFTILWRFYNCSFITQAAEFILSINIHLGQEQLVLLRISMEIGGEMVLALAGHILSLKRALNSAQIRKDSCLPNHKIYPFLCNSHDRLIETDLQNKL